MKAVMLTLLLTLLSCSQEAEVARDSFGAQIKNVSMKVSHLHEIDWKVGMKKEEVVTQSFTFLLGMPKVSADDLKHLTQQYGVDAWIVRLIVARGSKAQNLGSLYSLFQARKIGRGSSDTGAADSVSLKVYYAAAYASERFRSFKCPAFDHSKKISSIFIKGSNDDFELAVGKAIPYNEKSQKMELIPSSFNGGNSLTGEYFLEIAPYNSQTRTIYGNFKRLPMSVVVEKEDLIRIPSCDGVHPERE